MRTLRAALASTTPLGLHPACATSPEISVRMAETAVRHQPKSLYGFNRFACTTPAETTVRFRPFYTTGQSEHSGYRRSPLGNGGQAAGQFPPQGGGILDTGPRPDLPQVRRQGILCTIELRRCAACLGAH